MSLLLKFKKNKKNPTLHYVFYKNLETIEHMTMVYFPPNNKLLINVYLRFNGPVKLESETHCWKILMSIFILISFTDIVLLIIIFELRNMLYI